MTRTTISTGCRQMNTTQPTGNRTINVQHKGDIANAATAAIGVSGLIQSINGWVSEFMPLITVAGMVIGLGFSWWYYSASLKQKERHYRESHEAQDDE